jgi:hypothetical protein
VTRTRLNSAASSLASDLYGRDREWRILNAKRIAHEVGALVGRPADGLTDRAEIERFVEYYGDLLHEVRLRLGNGEWTAWGWRQDDTTPVKIAIELFQRDDVEINPERNTISCAVCNFDNVTVDVAMEGIPAVGQRKNVSEKEINDEFAAWAKSRDEYPDKEEADEWAKKKGYSTTIVRPLHAASNPRGRGRRKQKAGLKGS